jgi:hypothetical protein
VTVERQQGDEVAQGEQVDYRRLKEGRAKTMDEWAVVTKGQPEVCLGWVRWLAAWRCYVFSPGDFPLEAKILGDISAFVTERTIERRGGEWKDDGSKDPIED